MNRDEYMRWWIALPEDVSKLDEPVRTLVEHINALSSRIDDLPEELNCCCAYDHPLDVCMVHERPDRRPA